MVADHSFRALNDDPMFGSPYNWPRQDWKANPAPKASSLKRPMVINGAAYLKRGLMQEILAATATSPANGTDVQGTARSLCHVDLHREELAEAGVDYDLDYDNLTFEDMYGNQVDGRTCDIIYDDISEAKLLIDEDGNVEYVYDDERSGRGDIPVTRHETTVPESTNEAPKPSILFPRPPASTTDSRHSSGSVITAPPKVPTESLSL